MKHLLILIGLITMLSSVRCVEVTPPEFEEIHSMLYIDLSLSRDSISISNAVDKMQKIFLAQPKDVPSRFIVKVIDSDNSVSALFDHYTDILSDTRHDGIKEYNEIRMKQVQKMREIILNYYMNVAPNKVSSKQSCICNSIINSYSYFEQLDTKKHKLQLFVFSDMFEECNRRTSYFKESFSMCNGESGRRNSMKKLMQIVKDFTPSDSLKKYVKAENLYFIRDENDLYNESGKACLNPEEIRSLWNEIFLKLGYSNGDLKKITFDNMVPNHLLETED